MQIQGKCDPKLGPVVRVAVGTANRAGRRRNVLAWVYGVLNEDSLVTLVSEKAIEDLRLWSNEGIRASLLFRGDDCGGWAFFRDLEVEELNTLHSPSNRRFLDHDPRIDVVIGRNVIDRGALVMHSDGLESEKVEFVFHVDTGTGIVPVFPAN